MPIDAVLLEQIKTNDLTLTTLDLSNQKLNHRLVVTITARINTTHYELN